MASSTTTDSLSTGLRMSRLIRCPNAGPAVALFALLLGSSACRLEDAFSGFDLCGSGTDRIASVSLQPAQVNLRPGDVAELTSIRVGTKGETILLCAPLLTWDSSNPAVARIASSASTGTVRAVAAGTTVISVHSGGQSASSTITVTSAPIASMAIEPQRLTLRVGQTVRLSVSARDSAGNAVTVRAITWSSDDQVVATVSSSGLLVAVDSGTASVRATVE